MRYLDLGTVDAQSSQAVYHALAELMTADGPATLVTVSPNQPYVCVGYHQIAGREIDRRYCEAHDIPVARRMVGGGAVWLDHDQVFWHLIVPHALLSVDELYRRYLIAPVHAYRQMGIAAEHRPVNDIVVGQRKIGGTGASTLANADVLVGSLMLDFDTQAMARVLQVPSEKFRDKVISSLHDYMTTVRRELGAAAPTREQATQILVDAFAQVLCEEVRRDCLTPQERTRTEWYAQRLFSPDFVYRHEGHLEPGIKIRAGVRVFEGLYKASGGLVRVIWREVEGIIDEVVIGGDFFVDPVDGLANVQSALVGGEVKSPEREKVFRELWEGLDVPGVTAADVIAAFRNGQELAIDARGHANLR